MAITSGLLKVAILNDQEQYSGNYLRTFVSDIILSCDGFCEYCEFVILKGFVIEQ